MESLIKQKLEEHPWFRERKAKNYGIARLLIREYHLEDKIDPKTLEDILTHATSLDRYWRKVTETNPHLQGSDYNDRVKLMQEKQIELGYEPNYNKDIKQKELL